MGIECKSPSIDYFKKSLWQRLFDDPSFVRSEIVQLPRKMSGKEILDARKRIETSGWEVSLLPYENGFSITGEVKPGKKIRFVLDLASSPGGNMGLFQTAELVRYDYDNMRLVPLEPKITWGHLKEKIFDKVHVMFFRVYESGYEKRICWKFPTRLTTDLFVN